MFPTESKLKFIQQIMFIDECYDTIIHFFKYVWEKW